MYISIDIDTLTNTYVELAILLMAQCSSTRVMDEKGGIQIDAIKKFLGERRKLN